MATVTPLKMGSGAKSLGTFKVEQFSMFDEDGLKAYAEFKNREADKSNGIKIELVREYTRKTTETSGEGASTIHMTTEEVILVVHYWEKPAGRPKGDSNEAIREAKSVLVGR